jgi:hypothetical protein
MSGFDPESILAVTSAVPPAKLSFKRPQSPLGSAAETAMPAIITLSRMSFHSSGVKFDLSVISFSPTLSSPPEPCQPIIKARMLMMRKFRNRAEDHGN